LTTCRRYLLLIVAMSLTLPPLSAQAWDSQAGSPPGWLSHWVRTTEPVDVFANATGDLGFGQADQDRFFRVDAPEQHGRLWVYDPLGNDWGWLPAASTRLRRVRLTRARICIRAPRISRRGSTALSPAKAVGTPRARTG
jgi:hypothetical protein